MFVGHAPSLEGCSRQLIGEPIRSFEEFLFINRQITFLSMAQCERNMMTGKWELTPIRVNNCDDSNTAVAVAAINEFQVPVMPANSGGYLTYECGQQCGQQQQQRQVYQDPYNNCFYAG